MKKHFYGAFRASVAFILATSPLTAHAERQTTYESAIIQKQLDGARADRQKQREANIRSFAVRYQLYMQGSEAVSVDDVVDTLFDDFSNTKVAKLAIITEFRPDSKNMTPVERVRASMFNQAVQKKLGEIRADRQASLRLDPIFGAFVGIVVGAIIGGKWKASDTESVEWIRDAKLKGTMLVSAIAGVLVGKGIAKADVFGYGKIDPKNVQIQPVPALPGN